MNKMNLFSVLVTGANRGIGLEFTKQLLQLDPPPKHLFATYRSDSNLKNLEKLRDHFGSTTNVHLLKLDVTNSNEIENAREFIAHVVGVDGLTLLINNAGVAEPQGFPNITPENLNHHFSANTVGPVLMTQAMYPLLKASARRKKGVGMGFSRAAVLNMTSMTASIQNTGETFTQDLVAVSYKISKAGLNMAMKVIAAKVKADDILVVCICPGFVKTDMARGMGELEPKESIAAMLATIAKLDETHTGTYMDRFGNPYPY